MGRRWLKVASDVTSGSAAVTSCERRDVGQGGGKETASDLTTARAAVTGSKRRHIRQAGWRARAASDVWQCDGWAATTSGIAAMTGDSDVRQAGVTVGERH